MEWLHQLERLKRYDPASKFDDLIIAGPCAIESIQQITAISSFLSALNIKYLRGGAYKHRTSPYSFSGLKKEGLIVLWETAKLNNQQTVSEILSVRDLEDFDKYVDIIMIGARNMRNYSLIEEVASLKKPIILKRSMDSTIKDWLFAAEHYFAYGGNDIILCERGVKTFDPEFKNILDISSTCLIKENLNIPLIVDPSHGTGVKQIMGRVAKAFLSAGANGYMLEVHNDPEQAKCDREHALNFEEFLNIYQSLSLAH